jgi:hypothetical protein
LTAARSLVKDDKRSAYDRIFGGAHSKIIGLAADITAVTLLVFFSSYRHLIIVSSVLALVAGLALIPIGWRKRRSKGLIFGLVVSLIGAGVSGFWLHMQLSPTTTVSCVEPTATTEYPRDGERIPARDARQFMLRAQLSGPLCGGISLWAFVRLATGVNPTYFQQEGPCEIKNLTLQCGTIGIVGQPGSSAEIVVYKIDGERLRHLVDVETKARTSSGGTQAAGKDLRASPQPPVPQAPLVKLTISIL